MWKVIENMFSFFLLKIPVLDRLFSEQILQKDVFSFLSSHPESKIILSECADWPSV